MKLHDLAHELKLPAPDENPEVLSVTHNAAWVTPGSLFVAIRGAKFDGHSFLTEVANKGAVAVLGEGLPAGVASPLPYLRAADARVALADAAAALSGHPSRKLQVIGVTGTDGKTTTAWLTVHLLRAAGLPSGLLSTVGYQLPDGLLRHFPAHFTTPEAPQVQGNLTRQLEAGAGAVVLEASSHALALERVRAIDWNVAIWTQLTSEHLDFHGSVESYFAEKRKLIERAPFSVLNADDPWTQRLAELGPHVLYGEAAGADWRVSEISEGQGGLGFTVASPLGQFKAELPMIGRFNVHNALAAMAAAAHLGATVPQLQAGLASFRGVPGRMELVPDPYSDRAGGRRVVVDFAHTPPSLEKTLSTLRATTAGRLSVVIGSAGGPRDPSKRAPLGEVATRLADLAIFTEEDSRGTPINNILAEMERGAAGPSADKRTNFVSIPDRREAIQHTIALARSGDTVLLAGKGPEDTMERLHETVAWNEVWEAAEALALPR